VKTPPLTVGEITRYLTEIFANDDLLSDLWIEGEVVEATVSRAGHCYFSVAEADAKLKCVMFRSALQRQSYTPVVGQSCAIHGAISIYAREGLYQLQADFVRPAGIGLAALELELLRQQLTAEGLFEPSRKRQLPLRIGTVGLVTSAEGAVRHDIETVLRRRNPFVHLILSPATVQGDAAVASLRFALRRLIEDGRSDVIILGRGGGAASDLSAFNDESLVRAVFASPIPVISAVGHESDWTLLDLVADLRAATPSAAAEIASTQVTLLARQLRNELERHGMALRRELSTYLQEIDIQRDSMQRKGPSLQIASLRQSVANSRQTLVRKSAEFIESGTERRRYLEQEATRKAGVSLAERNRRRDRAWALLKVLDPASTLSRGYAVLEDANRGVPIRSTHDAYPGQLVHAHVCDGVIAARVESGG